MQMAARHARPRRVRASLSSQRSCPSTGVCAISATPTSRRAAPDTPPNRSRLDGWTPWPHRIARALRRSLDPVVPMSRVRRSESAANRRVWQIDPDEQRTGATLIVRLARVDAPPRRHDQPVEGPMIEAVVRGLRPAADRLGGVVVPADEAVRVDVEDLPA